MKVPDLEEMIQQQITGNYICEGCQRLLTEHYLISDPLVLSEILVCCHEDNKYLTFKLPKGAFNFNQVAITLSNMLSEKDRECVTGLRWLKASNGVVLTKRLGKEAK